MPFRVSLLARARGARTVRRLPRGLERDCRFLTRVHFEKMKLRSVISLAAAITLAAVAPAAPLKIAVVQYAPAPSFATNGERMVAAIGDAAQRGARVVVF